MRSKFMRNWESIRIAIARASFCVKKYQALNRVIEYTSKYDNICDEAIYTYDEQGFPQSLKKEDSQEI